MGFIEQLTTWDTNLFLSLNSHHSAFWDGFMWIFSSKYIWIPAVLTILIVLFKDKRREFLFILLGIAVTILLCDQISSAVFKPLVQRLRPSHALGDLVHLVNGYKGGPYGFISSHAANAFGFAMFTSLIIKFRPYAITIFVWAFVNACSRIYLGVHYPLDIICGALVGIICALLVYLLFIYLRKIYTGFTFKASSSARITPSGIHYNNMWIVIGMLLLTVFFMLIFSIELVKFVS